MPGLYVSCTAFLRVVRWDPYDIYHLALEAEA